MAPVLVVLIVFSVVVAVTLPVPLWVARALPRRRRPALAAAPEDTSWLGVEGRAARSEAQIVGEAIAFALRLTEDVRRAWWAVRVLGGAAAHGKDNWATALVERQQRAAGTAWRLYGEWVGQVKALPQAQQQRLPPGSLPPSTSALVRIEEAEVPIVGLPSRAHFDATCRDLEQAYTRVLAFTEAVARGPGDPYR